MPLLKMTFTGKQLDSLKTVFQRADKLDRYCRNHMARDVEGRNLGKVGGVNIVFYYQFGSRNSCLELENPKCKLVYNYVILNTYDGKFIDYLTTYSKCVDSKAKKEERRAERDRKALEHFNNL
jgi:hypothetical protein